jgi:type II secretory pathway pseudopilin PulG
MFTSRNISAKSRLRGFTLLEVTLALTILMLLVGVLYAMVDATVRSAAQLQEKQNRNQELSAFLTLCRKSFHTMPADVLFAARVVPQGNKYASELIFRKAPGLFWWGDPKNASASTILGVRSQVGGLVSVAILQDSEKEITSYLNGGMASRPWLVLFPDLRQVEWRFFDSRSALWSKDWNDTLFRPAFVELTLTTEEGAEKYIFWVPPLKNINQPG